MIKKQGKLFFPYFTGINAPGNLLVFSDCFFYYRAIFFSENRLIFPITTSFYRVYCKEQVLVFKTKNSWRDYFSPEILLENILKNIDLCTKI